jgi:hypothetical protein
LVDETHLRALGFRIDPTCFESLAGLWADHLIETDFVGTAEPFSAIEWAWLRNHGQGQADCKHSTEKGSKEKHERRAKARHWPAIAYFLTRLPAEDRMPIRLDVGAQRCALGGTRTLAHRMKTSLRWASRFSVESVIDLTARGANLRVRF